ncbi:MAG: M28 family peptidase [Bacteroidetes bacterium]|nr:M28 family peptidase [Bacteroidota bacterium]
MKNYLYFVVVGAILFSSCGNNNKKIETDKTTENENKITVKVPVFNGDSAYYFVKKQVGFGPRVTNSKENKKCADYIAGKLKEYTDDVSIQNGKMRAFDGSILNLKNIIASFNPEKTDRIFLCSHWDSRPFSDQDPDKENHSKPILGANDGASGVGVLMEIARLLKISKPNIGVDLILFDAEDYGQPENSTFPDMEDSWCLGSQYWSNNPHKPNYNAKYGILLDMVGAENATFTMEGTSMFYASDFVRKVWDAGKRAGFENYFVAKETKEIIDDHMYINRIKKIPTIDIIQYEPISQSNFYVNWHTQKDDMNGINKNTLKAVGQTLLTVIFEEK